MSLTVCGVLDDAAGAGPDRTFLVTSEARLTFEEFRQATLRAAHGFQARGLGPGDRVVLLMRNSAEFVIAWVGLNRLGVVAVPLNVGLRGAQLAHQLSVAEPHGVIVDAEFIALVSAADLVDGLAVKLVNGPLSTPDPGWSDFGAVLRSEPLAETRTGKAADPAMVLFTSGTTGVSKGCVLSNRYLVRQGQLLAKHLELTADDVLYCPFPLFHADAVSYTVMPAMVLGATAAIGARFSASRFWAEIREFGATVFDFMGATLTMLHNAPPDPDDVKNPVRLAWGVPVPPFAEEFEERFGLRVVELYGSTDAGIPIVQPLDEPRRAGSCGRAIPEYEVRLLGEDGAEVETGDVGEIVIRPNEPNQISEGYLGMPEATLRSRRDLWFHTGDLASRDADGFFYFAGRSNDVIRRRGENISAHEIEEVVQAYPGIAECAVFGVPSALTEEEVMLAYTVTGTIDVVPEELIIFCNDRLASWMVPRYVEQLDDLPRTPTEKVKKSTLKRRGVVSSTWDREQHSVRQ